MGDNGLPLQGGLDWKGQPLELSTPWRPLRTTWRCLPLLHSFLLLSMPLLKLLRLLLMPLLHLLLARFIGILLRHLLVFFFLLLLELLSLLILLLLKLFLLSLVLLIQFRVPSIGGSWTIHCRKIVWVYRIRTTSLTPTRLIRSPIRGWSVRPSGFTGSNRTVTGELAWSLSSRNWRFSTVC